MQHLFLSSRGPVQQPSQGMGARRAVLDPPEVQEGGTELDLVPSQVAQLRGSQYEQPAKTEISIE